MPTTPSLDAALGTAPETGPASALGERLLRIQEVAAEVGATARAIRYYEEIGLLQPAARSEGDYRLYDQSDLERIRHIRELRDTAGISLAEVGQLLEDEDGRAANRAAYKATEDPGARAGILTDSIARLDHAIAILEGKEARLHAMVEESLERRDKLSAKLAALSRPETAT